MTYNFFEAYQRALNVMRKELNEAYEAWGHDQDNEILKARYEVYKLIVEKLDSLA